LLESPPAASPPSPTPLQRSSPWEGGGSPPLDLGFVVYLESISLYVLHYLDQYEPPYMIMDTVVTALTIVIWDASCYVFTIVLEPS
jgi:hypothetical protein